MTASHAHSPGAIETVQPIPPLVWTTAERIELSERFYLAIFRGCLILTGLASIAALALLPLRQPPGAGAAPTIALAALLAMASAPAARRPLGLYRLLRRDWRWELVIVAVAAALIAYPLRSQLWWPACALLMLLAILAPLGRTLTYCLATLLVNLVAHTLVGDLGDTPAVAITGLWVGFGFWTTAFALSSDRLASHILHLQTTPPTMPPQCVRVRATVHHAQEPASAPEPPPPAPEPPAPPSDLKRLTFRQAQVVALLAEGLRYADIADWLSISERQVQRHVSQAIKRLDVANANQLVALAVSEGLVDPPGP